MKIEISETLYRQMRSVVAGLQAKPTSTRHLNAVRRGRQLIRKLPTIEQIKNVNVSLIKTPNNEN